MFQTFEPPAQRAAAAERIKEPAPAHGAARRSTPTSCRAPTSTRASTCRHRPSASSGSRDSRARPASRSSPRRRRPCSSTAATPCRRAPRSTPPRLEVSQLPRAPRRRMARRASGRGQHASASIRGCIRSARSSGSAPRSSRKASSSNRSTATSSTACGAASRPAPPANPVTVHPLKLAGRSAQDKIADIQKRLKADGHDAVVLTLERFGRLGVQHPRLGHSAHPRGARLRRSFRRRESPSSSSRPRSSKRLRARSSRRSPSSARRKPSPTASRPCARPRSACGSIRNTAASWFARALGGPRRIARGPDPCLALKAVKNAAEIKGARAAHMRDGDRGHALPRLARPGRRRRARSTRSRRCAGSKPSAARPTSCARSASTPSPAAVPTAPSSTIASARRRTASCAQANCSSIDSGAQYLDGTTDITRTVAIGKPSSEMRERFTLVLKGHIAIATARFPEGTRGIDLDPLARRALWQHGLDYDHGTGHGVGSYLSVHEGPQSISQGRHGRASARHDLLQRARILQGGRLRHPHREPRARDGRRTSCPAATAR